MLQNENCDISEMCEYVCTNVANLFTRQLRKRVLLCAVFT